MRRILVAFLVLLIPLAGCLGEKPAATDCTGESCPPPSSGSPDPTGSPTPGDPDYVFWPEGVDFPPLPVNESKRTILREDCAGAEGPLMVPLQNFDGRLPPGLDPHQYQPYPGQGQVFLEALVCDRVVMDGRVLTDVSELFVMASVDVTNESWNKPGRDFYLLDYFSTSQEAVDSARKVGIPSTLASVSISSATSGPPEIQQWEVSNESSMVSFEVSVTEQGSLVLDGGYSLWIGWNYLLRANVASSATYETPVYRTEARLSGTSNGSRLIDAPVTPFEESIIRSVSGAITVELELFGDV